MLQNIISDIEKLPKSATGALPPWDSWSRTAAIRVQRVFGPGSSQVEELQDYLKKIQQRTYADLRFRETVALSELIKSMILEVSELWEDEPPTATGERLSSDRTREPDKPLQPLVHDQAVDHQVFIVHGHDHGRLQTVARFLERLKLTVIILHERPNEGETIIEKLETHGNTAFAVILLTPDDVGSVATQADKLKPRARQNVVLELGYFLGRLGRRKVAALVSDGVELPSDYSGVVYINLDDQGAWQFHLAKELRAAGLPIHGDALL